MNKTQQTENSIDDFLNKYDDEKKEDCYEIINIMRDLSGYEPKLWGDSIIGFGLRHYKYESGREGDWFIMGFAPRKQNLTLYLSQYFERHKDILIRLGKYKSGKACIYIKSLIGIEKNALRELIEVCYKDNCEMLKNIESKD